MLNVGIIGGVKCSKQAYEAAEDLGRRIASKGWIVICGGGPGIMEAVCKGAKQNNGITVGILPWVDSRQANSYLDIRIPTGLGYARNFLIVRASDVLVAVDGKYGTLSELSFALCEGKKVLGLNTWPVKGVVKVKTPEQAVRKISSWQKVLEKRQAFGG